MLQLFSLKTWQSQNYVIEMGFRMTVRCEMCGWQSTCRHEIDRRRGNGPRQEMDYCLGTYHLLPSVPVQSFGTKMDKF